MSVWASRKSLPEVRTEIPGLAAKGTQAPELQKALTLEMIQSRYPKSTGTTSSQMALQKMLLGMEAVVPTSVAQMEQPPPSPSQLVTWAPTTEQKYTPWKLPQNSWLRKTATSRISSCCLTPCLLFSLWQNDFLYVYSPVFGQHLTDPAWKMKGDRDHIAPPVYNLGDQDCWPDSTEDDSLM